MTLKTQLITALDAILLLGCTSISAHEKTLSWIEYESMDGRSRKARISLLSDKAQDCSSRDYCADLHYQLAMAYLSEKNPNRKALGAAEKNLKKATLGGKNEQHALLLLKVLRGWITNADQNKNLKKEINTLEKEVNTLKKSLEQAIDIDLEMSQEDVNILEKSPKQAGDADLEVSQREINTLKKSPGQIRDVDLEMNK